MKKNPWSPKIRQAKIWQIYQNDDQLIHAFHISLRTGKAARSFANNLIEGSHEQVVDLLDRLFAIHNGVDKDQWSAGIEEMYNRRRGRV